MTKSQFFKAAHKLAKAYQASMGGDYVVYLSLALKNMVAASKVYSDEKVFAAMNKAIKKHGGTTLRTR